MRETLRGSLLYFFGSLCSLLLFLQQNLNELLTVCSKHILLESTLAIVMLHKTHTFILLPDSLTFSIITTPHWHYEMRRTHLTPYSIPFCFCCFAKDQLPTQRGRNPRACNAGGNEDFGLQLTSDLQRHGGTVGATLTA